TLSQPRRLVHFVVVLFERTELDLGFFGQYAATLEFAGKHGTEASRNQRSRSHSRWSADARIVDGQARLAPFQDLARLAAPIPPLHDAPDHAQPTRGVPLFERPG